MSTRTPQGGRRRDPLSSRITPWSWVPASSWALAVLALSVAPLLAAADPEAGITGPGIGHLTWWAGFLLITAQAVTLIRREDHASAVLLLCSAAVAVAGAIGLGDTVGALAVATLIASYGWGLRVATWRRSPELLVASALVALGSVGTADPAWSAVVQGLGVVLLPLLAASWVRGRHELDAAREERTRAVAGELEARVRSAIAEERTEMARELHDIAAHHLSGITVMASAISAQIDTDPAAARRGIAQVRQQSTEVLQDLRSLVGLLRDPGADPPGGTRRVTPQSLHGIPCLVETSRATGAAISYAVLPGPTGTTAIPGDGTASMPSAAELPEGFGAGIGPLSQLTGYRMVQESLSNAARHAPGAPCTVLLDDSDPDWFRLDVTNGPAAHPLPRRGTGGVGLVGMQERADLTSARLVHGATPTGGWTVTLSLPRHPTVPGGTAIPPTGGAG